MQYIKKTIGEIFVESVNKHPDKVFVNYDNFDYTYKDIFHLAILESNRLKKLHKLSSKDYVAIYATNSIEWIVFFIALQFLGVKTVLFNPHFRYETLLKLIRKHSIKLCLYSNNNDEVEYCDTIKIIKDNLNNECRFIDMKYSREKILSNLDSEINSREIRIYDDYKDTALVIFTSGTSALEKGVKLSHYSLINNAMSMSNRMNWDSEDVFCVSVPFFHCFGMTTCILTSIILNAKMVVLKNISTIGVSRAVEKHKCTVLNGVPTMFLAICRKNRTEEHDFSSLKTGVIAGSPIYKEDYLEIVNTFPNFNLQPSYGQSETSPCITLSHLTDDIYKKSETVGKVIDDVKIRIVDIESREILPKGSVGEIESCGYNVMTEYLNDEEKTREVFSKDNWLKTGDIGYIDEDDYLHIEGRKKNLIIRAGENISPVKIEQKIKSFNSSIEVLVLGVKSEVLQEEIAVCLLSMKKDDEFAEKLNDYLRKKIPSYAMPKYYIFLENYDRTALGKIKIKSISKKVEAMIEKNDKNVIEY